MQADPGAQQALLTIADLDTRIARLRHRQATLPEHTELQQLAGQRAGLSEQIVATETRISDARGEQDRLDADLTPARARRERNQRTIDAGAADPKALQSMIAETEHLQGRIAALEDSMLEAMQLVEDETAVHDQLVAQRAEVEQRMRELLSRRDAAKGDLDIQITEMTSQREQLTGRLPAELVALYEKVAARQQTGAAELRARRCGGCGIEIDTTELKRIAAAAAVEVVRCEECGRVLVRTGAPEP